MRRDADGAREMRDGQSASRVKLIGPPDRPGQMCKRTMCMHWEGTGAWMGLMGVKGKKLNEPETKLMGVAPRFWGPAGQNWNFPPKWGVSPQRKSHKGELFFPKAKNDRLVWDVCPARVARGRVRAGDARARPRHGPGRRRRGRRGRGTWARRLNDGGVHARAPGPAPRNQRVGARACVAAGRASSGSPPPVHASQPVPVMGSG